MSNELVIAKSLVNRLRNNSSIYHERKLLYQQHPEQFAHDVLGIDLTPYQVEIMQTLVSNKRVAVRAPHGAGKTAMSACLVLWAIACFETEVKVLTTASAWRQLVQYTWPEINKWARQADWSLLGISVRDGKELLQRQVLLDHDGFKQYAFAAASDQPSSMEGLHAPVMLVVFDEAKAISVAMWDAIEGAFSTGKGYALAISTPGDPSGRFYDIHAHAPGLSDWATRHITLEECLANGRFNEDWVQKRREQWGEKSAVFQNRVMGEFADSDESAVIPLSWIERSNRLYEQWEENGAPTEGLESWGVDVAYLGEDRTAFAHLLGKVCLSLESFAKQDLMQTAGAIAARLDLKTPVAIDTIGVGAGVFSRLDEQGYNAISVNVSAKTDATDVSGKVKFFNLRSAVWWALREALDPALGIDLMLPPDPKLIGELTAPTWWYTSNGAIQVESKDDIRARIGRSTDYADALGLAYYAQNNQGWSLDSINDIAINRVRTDLLSEDMLELLRLSGVDPDKLNQFRLL